MNKCFIFFLMLVSLVGCKKTEETPGEKPLVVILSPDNPPFEFKDTAKGGNEVRGFDVDVIKEMSRRMGKPLKIIEAEFGALIPSLQAGRADIAISELTPSDERKKAVDFSDIYYTNPAALLVPENTLIRSEADVGGKRLGVQLGSTNEAMGRVWKKTFPDLSLVSLGKIGELVQELKNGRLEALLVGRKVALNIAESTMGFKVIDVKNSNGELAMVFPKGSSLVRQVNAILNDMKPEIKKFAEKWLGNR